jgi:hypothetical protein
MNSANVNFDSLHTGGVLDELLRSEHGRLDNLFQLVP